MTGTQSRGSTENVIGGTLFSLLAVPLGVVILVLLSSIGFVASIVGYVVAFCAVWLYRRGSGGVISRVGAWAVTAVVFGTLILGIWISMVVTYARGIGHLSNLGLPGFWPQFGADFSANVKADLPFIALVLLFGLIGSFRTLRRAFMTARVTGNQPTALGQVPFGSAPRPYVNDIDAAPTGSADDKTPPPTGL
jgi:hypothetical protein